MSKTWRSNYINFFKDYKENKNTWSVAMENFLSVLKMLCYSHSKPREYLQHRNVIITNTIPCHCCLQLGWIGYWNFSIANSIKEKVFIWIYFHQFSKSKLKKYFHVCVKKNNFINLQRGATLFYPPMFFVGTIFFVFLWYWLTYLIWKWLFSGCVIWRIRLKCSCEMETYWNVCYLRGLHYIYE